MQRRIWHRYAEVVAPAVVMIVAGVIALVHIRTERQAYEAAAQREAQLVSHWVAKGLEAHARAVRRMADRWLERGGLPLEEWRPDARAHVEDLPGIRAVWIAGSSGQVIAAYPETTASQDILPMEALEQTAAWSAVGASDYLVEQVGSVAVVLAGAGQGPDGTVFIGLVDPQALLAPWPAAGGQRGLHVELVTTPDALASPPDAEARVEDSGVAWRVRVERADPSAGPLLSGAGLAEIGLGIGLAAVAWALAHGLVVRIREAESRAETELTAILQTAPDAAIVADEDGRILAVNHATEATFGFSEEEILGERVETLIPDALQQRHEVHRPALEGVPDSRSTGAGHVLPGRRKDGLEVPLEIATSPLPGHFGEKVVVFARDVSLREKAQVELRESERRFRSIVEDSMDGIYVSSVDGRFIEVNPAMARIFGYSREELRNLDAQRLYLSEEDRSSFRAIVETRGAVTGLSTRLRHRGGAVVECVETATTRRNDAGEAVGYSGIIRDVTAERRAAERLQTQEKWQRNLAALGRRALELRAEDELLAEVAAVVTRLLPVRGCLFAEVAAGHLKVSMLAGDVRAEPGQDLGEVRGDGDRSAEGLADAVGSLLMRYGPAVDFPAADPGPVTVQVAGVPAGVMAVWIDRECEEPVEMKTLLDSVASVVGSALGRLRAERELRQSEEQLQQAQKLDAIGKLAGGIAHDFNNLLTGILGYTHLARAELEPGSRAHEDLGTVDGLAQQGAKLTGQILAFARRQPLSPLPIDLTEMLQSMTSLLRRLVGETYEVHLEPAPGLWRCMVDRSQMEQVVMNLAINARDAMPAGGRLVLATENVDVREPRRVGISKPGRYVRLAVVDEGQGMDDDTRRKIFEPFFSTKGDRGTGLGLSVVHGIVYQHGGEIVVRSEPGQGTTFSVFLPAVDDDTGDDAPSAR